MSSDEGRRRAVPIASPAAIPKPPPLPVPKPLQRAREAAYRFIGYPASRPSTPDDELINDRAARAGLPSRSATLSATQNASAIHKTGLEINTIAINEPGTHALVGGREIFKTIKVDHGTCAEDLNLRSVIRSTPTSASGKPRQVYSVDIADVAWAKGDFSSYVAAATSSGKIILYDVGHAALHAVQLHEHVRQVHKVTFNPHRGNLLLSGSQDGTVRLWDVRTMRSEASSLQSKHKYSGQSDGVRDVKWSPTDGVDFAFGTDSGWVQRWDIRNLKAAKLKIAAHTLSCNVIDWHPDGKHIASASTDKTVRIWNFEASKKGRADWEIKTPYPVMNARWRSSCESSMLSDDGARQCIQLATGYDSEHAVVHVWDLRRPALPFREMVPYVSAPTDLLWHSQDLLWTVGREGTFIQSDIQHAPKVIDRRNLQCFAVSPLGDVNPITTRRTQRRTPKPRDAAEVSSSPDEWTKDHATFVSRSWDDDGLDHIFLSIRPVKAAQYPANLVRTTSATSNDLSNTLALDQILHNRKSFSPPQQAVRGAVPYHIDRNVIRFLAINCVKEIDLFGKTSDAFFENVQAAFDRNVELAKQAGMKRDAVTWRLAREATLSHLKVRLAAHQRGKDVTSPFIFEKWLAADIEAGQPFELVQMLKQMTQEATSHGSIHLIAPLLLLISPLLPSIHPLPDHEQKATMSIYSEALDKAGFEPKEIGRILNEDIKHTMTTGLQPLQIETILALYHGQLLEHRLFAEAAEIRQMAYPAYPSVYDSHLNDNAVHKVGRARCE
ncbi:SEA (Seh1-associated) complex subunit [Recurvomyces mirabilis]|uniref:SEA (Seh1-associated) complex subunit n=1 Tax=Recurvomyces mirabilis TaxID=574656 RepID=A0AAE0WRT3_9PEZI|nr:SEA (Seh1-associated) complex subunit [Recurvomyces mirabilis]KAK5154534.1 SEA (Seh1-associated) complex subunit [Recurvomyces mirabilis]